MDQIKDKWIRLLGIPLTAILVNLLYIEEYRNNWWLYATMCVFSIGYTTFLWNVSVRWVAAVRGRYQAIEQTRKRIILTFTGYLLIAMSSQLGIVAFIDLLNIPFFAPRLVTYLKQACVGLVWIIVIGASYEVLYYLRMYRDAITQSEAIHKERLQQQYDHLKNQVNPHFLFNSLNSLSSLIDENPRQANEFLDELSSVYRYLLQNHEHQLTTLNAEIRFLKSYYHLLKSRFGKGIEIDIDLDELQTNALIPPLSLQLLIENAITHNTIEPERPLKISIRHTADGHLQVTNTNQRKPRQVDLTIDRIATIKARYRQLNLPEPTVTDNENTTIVWLPLLGKKYTREYLYGNDGLV